MAKPKIIFWLDSDLLHFCMSYYLQKISNCDMYAIIDATNRQKKFFQKQKLVQFKKFWFYFDHVKPQSNEPDLKFLAEFEKKYNINLWQLALNERIFYNFNKFYKFSEREMLLILEQECRLFETIIDEVSPDFFLTRITSLHHHHLFYLMCRKHGIKVLMLYSSKLGYRCAISDELHKIDAQNKVTEENIRNFEQLKNYVKSFKYVDKIESYNRRFAKSKTDKLKAAYSYFVLSNNRNKTTHYTYFGRTKLRVFIDSIISVFKKKYRMNFINKNFLLNPRFDEPSVCFFLNVDEERNLLIGTPFYTNQTELIRVIAKSLPVGYKLYVKEHLSQVRREWRKISEYKEMMNIPNVRLLHPSYSAEKIYENSSLIISIAGTPSFEAAFYNKPSIIFTDYDFNSIPSIYRVKSFEELPQIIRSALNKKYDPKFLNEYVSKLAENTFDFDYQEFQSKELDFFFFGGNLVDVEIKEEKMKQFLEENKSSLQKVADEHIKKIKQFQVLESEKL